MCELQDLGTSTMKTSAIEFSEDVPHCSVRWICPYPCFLCTILPSSSGQQLQSCVQVIIQIRELIRAGLEGASGRNAPSIIWFIISPPELRAGIEGGHQLCCQEIKPSTTHFTSSTEIHQFKQIKRVYPGGLTQILLKPV